MYLYLFTPNNIYLEPQEFGARREILGKYVLQVRRSTGQPKRGEDQYCQVTQIGEVYQIRHRTYRNRMMHGVHQTCPVYINRDQVCLIYLYTIHLVSLLP